MSNSIKRKDEFYIGYIPKSSSGYAKTGILAISIIAIVLLVAGLTNGFFQKTFNPGYFEFGELTEVNGVLYKMPVPRLVISEEGAMPSTILLVGSGKMGALGTIEAMENELGDLIDGREVVVVHGTRYMPVWGYEFWVEEGGDEEARERVDVIVDNLIEYLRSIQR